MAHDTKWLTDAKSEVVTDVVKNRVNVNFQQSTISRLDNDMSEKYEDYPGTKL